MAITSKEIEKSSLSFGEGRRQNDVVNWTLAKMIEKPNIIKRELFAEWDDFFGNTATRDMKESLDSWDEFPKDRIEIVYNCYCCIEDQSQLEALIIDMEY